jgi:hypothetical protein
MRMQRSTVYPLSLYSRFEITTAIEGTPLLDTNVFEYDAYQKDVPQLAGRDATSADTNIPRSGLSGLPCGCGGEVTRWRMVTTVESEPLRSFCHHTTATLKIAQRHVVRTTLFDLSRAPVDLMSPAHLRPGDEYLVSIQCHNLRAWSRLASWCRLRGGMVPWRAVYLDVYLEGIMHG